MLLPLLVLLASSGFPAVAEEDPDLYTNFNILPTIIQEAMLSSLQQQAEAVDYTVMADSVTDALRAAERYGDRQKFAAVCWHFTGLEPIQGPNGEPAGYLPGESYGTALGVCNDVPLLLGCWQTGGALSTILRFPSNDRLQYLHSICVVFFSPREERNLGLAAAEAFTEQAHDTAERCLQEEFAARMGEGVTDLSQVANCVAASGTISEGQDHGPPRAVIIVPMAAAPGKSAPDGHILSFEIEVDGNGVEVNLELFASPPALSR